MSSTLIVFMLGSGIELVFLTWNVIKAEEIKCDDITRHQNIKLLPRKPNCGRKNIASTVGVRILNGTQVDRNEFPWLVYLEVKHKTRPGWLEIRHKPWRSVESCGGSLINNRYIVSSAHCVKQEEEVDIRVTARLGEWKLDKRSDYMRYCCAEGRLIIRVETIIYHKDFNSDGHNDISLLRLFETVTFNDYVRPICLPLTCFWQTKDLECNSVTIAGWGLIQVKPTVKETDIARKLQIEVVSEVYCQQQHILQHKILSSQLCAGGEPWRSPCKADSGDPVMLEEFIRGKSTHYLVGIVSYEWPCNLQDVSSILPPSVNTRVTSFVRWILNNIRP